MLYFDFTYYQMVSARNRFAPLCAHLHRTVMQSSVVKQEPMKPSFQPVVT